jgi:hypothetical protein
MNCNTGEGARCARYPNRNSNVCDYGATFNDGRLITSVGCLRLLLMRFN